MKIHPFLYNLLIISAIYIVIIVVFVINFRRIDKAIRRYVSKRFKVEISTGYNGTWRVLDKKNWLIKLGIELLQLVWILVFFTLIIALNIATYYFILN